jgi:hypothetical protein
MFRRIDYRYAPFQPAAVGAGETKELIAVKKGERVLWASYKVDIPAAASTDSTMILGDGTDTNGYIEAIDLETATAGQVSTGTVGTLLPASGGKLYAADDTIDVIYAGSSFGATNPKVTFCVAVVRDW